MGHSNPPSTGIGYYASVRINQAQFAMTSDTTIEPARRGMVAQLGRCFRRFGADSDGATAIEFAILAIPFSLLVFAILECCISFAAEQVMTNAADDVARQIRTGQWLEANITEAGLKKALCDRMEIFVPKGCVDVILVDLQWKSTFAELAKLTVKTKGDKKSNMEVDTSDFNFDPGGPLTKNMLRVYYPWPVMTNLLATQMSNLKDNKTLHFATVTWQNEPFDN